MRSRLFCRVGELAGVDFEISEEATIGRAPDNALVVPDKAVSTHHARIRWEVEDGWVLEDLGSTNGTTLDGLAVSGRQRLGRLHVIGLAATYDFIFQNLDAYSRETTREVPVVSLPEKLEGRTTVPASPVAATPPEAPPPAHRTTEMKVPVLPSVLTETSPTAETADVGKTVFVVEALLDGEWRRFPLRSGENIVGRGTEADVRLLDEAVSRRHAVLTVRGRVVTVRDLGSSNHTFVEGEKVGSERPIGADTALTFGRIEARVGEEPAGNQEEP